MDLNYAALQLIISPYQERSEIEVEDGKDESAGAIVKRYARLS